MDLSGKRLLVLGGTIHTYDIVKLAQEMGVYVIVVDDKNNGIAKDIANEKALISTTDLTKLEQYAKFKRIDGVFTGAGEFNIVNALNLCEKLNLPFYCSKYQWQVFSDKQQLKKACRKINLATIEEYSIESVYCRQSRENIRFPVIVKPAQSNGSKGITICRSYDELISGYDRATAVSLNDEALIERFLTSENVNVWFTIQNGEVTMSAIADKFTMCVNEKFAPQPVAHIFPSRHIDIFYRLLYPKICELCKELNIRNGTLDVLTFFEDQKVYIVEIAYRLCLAREYQIISYENQINSLEMYIRHSLTGKFSGYDNKTQDNPRFKNKYCMLTVLLRDGNIFQIKGMNEIAKIPDVINIIQYYHIGDEVKAQGTLQQAFARIYLCSSNIETLSDTIIKIQKLIRVEDSKCRSMLLEQFDIRKLSVYKKIKVAYKG